MRALLDRDLIIGWVSDNSGVEVGAPPNGVGLERLRFNGQEIVDLADLSLIHVTLNSGLFSLHSVQVDGSQPVNMIYQNRKSLVNDGGIYRVKTVEEVESELNNLRNLRLKTKLRANLTPRLGDVQDQIADLSKCLVLVLTHLAGGVGATRAKAAIDAVALDFSGIYDVSLSEETLRNNAGVLKSNMEDYYNSLVE